MALKEKHRSSIYTRLAPILGEEEAEAMLAHFPARDVEEPVTRADLAVGVADLRAEMAELRAEIRAELNAEIGSVRTEIERSSKRTIMWLVGVMIALHSVMLAAVGAIVSAGT